MTRTCPACGKRVPEPLRDRHLTPSAHGTRRRLWCYGLSEKARAAEPCPMCDEPMTVTGTNVVLGGVEVGTTWACRNPKCLTRTMEAGR